MKWLLRLLVVVLVVGAAATTVELFHAKGVEGAIDDLFGNGEGRPDPAEPPADGRDPAPAAPDGPPSPRQRGPGAASVLTMADADYDRGDFDGASSNYLAAKALAADDAEEDRAVRGLHKSLLAWGLTQGAPRVAATGAEAEAWYARRLAQVEAAPTEEAWLELLRYAAGARLRDRLPFLAAKALDAAQPKGAVWAVLDEASRRTGPRADDFAVAVESRGLARPRPAAVPAIPGTDLDAPSDTGRPSDDGVSGIGGVGRRGVPLGSFSSAMRTRLAEAARLHETGKFEYEQAGPGSSQRVEHRRRALESLRKARDIYVDAQGEDANSTDLDSRLREVTLMLAQLKKDAGIDGR